MAQQQEEVRPSPPSRASTGSSKKSLSLDLSGIIPSATQPRPCSNTLLFTNLQNVDIFRADNLQTIRDLISQTAPIHSWAPLKSFRRVVVSFYSDEAATAVRAAWDGKDILGEPCNVYFGRATSLDATAEHLALPDAGKLFFISPPPSPPHDWEMRLEGAPNKTVHADDLAEALAHLHRAQADSPVSPTTGDELTGGRTRRSRSSTLIYQPGDHGSHPDLPAIAVEDTTGADDQDDEAEEERRRPIMAHTARPPLELMEVDA